MILGEYFPLELRRHTIDSIRILEVIVFRIPLNFALPLYKSIVSHFPTQHRVGENVGLALVI